MTDFSPGWSKYRDLKRQYQAECRQAYNNYISSMINPNTNKVTKRLWSYIKNRKQDNSEIGPLTYQGSTYTDSKDKATVLAGYFSSVFTLNNTSILPEVNDSPLPSISPILVHVKGVAQLLTNIQSQKASGPDNLPARFCNQNCSCLNSYFQASLDQGTLPNIWKTAAIVPIFKKGSKTEPTTDQYPLLVYAPKFLNILYTLRYPST